MLAVFKIFPSLSLFFFVCFIPVAQMTLDLPAECKFLELQGLISSATSLPASRLRIRHGFPPKELKPPTSSGEDYRVPVQPGDRIMVDVVSVPSRDGDAVRRKSESGVESMLGKDCLVFCFFFCFLFLYTFTPFF